MKINIIAMCIELMKWIKKFMQKNNQEELCFRKRLPRFYELADQIGGKDSYWQNFDELLRKDKLYDNSMVMRVYLAYERILQELDDEAWAFLKKEASQYSTKKDEAHGRGWQQLFNILNQARAYLYLKSLNCTKLKFISRSEKPGEETPDLEGMIDSVRVLCEVKTINESDAEVQSRHNGSARTISNQLDSGFFKKLKFDLEKAKQQLEAYDASKGMRHIVLINIKFDDFFARSKDEYYKLIDQYLSQNKIAGIEIVFYNAITDFHSDICMKAATVFNEQLIEL